MISIFKIRMLPINPAKLKIYMKVHNIYHKICNQNTKKVKIHSVIFYLHIVVRKPMPLFYFLLNISFVFAVVKSHEILNITILHLCIVWF